MRHRRTLVRASVALAAGLGSLQVIPGAAALAAWPAVSPVLALCAGLAARAAGALTLAAAPLLVLALWRGRWFCHHLCPTGFCLVLCGRLRRRHPAGLRRMPPLGGALLLAMLVGAAMGLPVLLALDPLVIFNGAFTVWRMGREQRAVSWWPAAGLLVLAALSFWMPHLWCERLCPLGAFQSAAGRLGSAAKRRWGGRRSAAPPVVASGRAGMPRRGFLALAAGAIGGCLWAGAGRLAGPQPVVRPPGARPDPLFAGLCARCGNCLRACPQQIIVPDLGAAGLSGWLAPRLDFSRQYCSEWCRACTAVCPTGALRRLTLEAKRDLALGTARVERRLCLAWNEGQHCMVCQEYCPYQAVHSVEQNGVPCPVVEAGRCRGCGACESQCPADPRRAIRVSAMIPPARHLGSDRADARTPMS